MFQSETTKIGVIGSLASALLGMFEQGVSSGLITPEMLQMVAGVDPKYWALLITVLALAKKSQDGGKHAGSVQKEG